MSTIDILCNAISKKSPIRFVYNKPGKVAGIRIGNPHAAFVFVTKAGVESVKVHIAQTGGVSDSQQPLPSFRMFDIEDLVIQSVDEQAAPFPVHADYNPTWEGYSRAICLIR